MKRLLLAVAIAIGTFVSAPVAQVSAASVTIGDNGVTIRDGRPVRYRHYRDYYRHGDYYRHNGYHHPRHYRDYCRVKTVKTYRHHRLIIKKIRICR